ncbi:unnamed protein product [Kuraishia capsulata CBS 1993]|uniref:pyridoxal kinase n=1 Tax=Kuraishia capsulata CBS 1993 TaxID=1382522 RepID=W6MJM5_9ASCO|nr:uncharacterized protein KUCA_T00002718001 [Kuraishia capsulata CBS 1993]CDK26744.1 unnamed protein product [Kuraishia capsulata CBS 1993]
MTILFHEEMFSPASKVLSIQSHVVHGYVGNKAATFPLQTLGWDVDVLNSVNYSNHTGYGSVTGTMASGSELQDIYEGLKKIDQRYEAILTGYIHGADTVKSVGKICNDIKKKSPEVMWLLDPVMGDEGLLYVSEEVIPVYREILSSGNVDIITPNQFEAEMLVEFAIVDKQSLKLALSTLHNKFKVKHVVISSLSLSAKELEVECHNDESLFAVVSSFIEGLDDCVKPPVVLEIKKLESYFTGVGDLFSALLLDRVFKYSKEIADETSLHSRELLVKSTNEVMSVMSKVLEVTANLAVKSLGKPVTGKIGSTETMKECELRIVECRGLYSKHHQKYIPFELS